MEKYDSKLKKKCIRNFSEPTLTVQEWIYKLAHIKAFIKY